MIKLIVLTIIITFIWSMGLRLIKKWDSPNWVMVGREYLFCVVVSMANVLIIERMAENSREELCLSILAGCLLFACITDCKMYEVYQFVWWIGGICGLFCLRGNRKELAGFLFFCLLQEVFFCRFYGRADCHAFVLCAMILFGKGMGMKECLVHMLLAFSGLAVVQLFRKNINKEGNLKQPVAFLPYITASFWLNCYCFC